MVGEHSATGPGWDGRPLPAREHHATAATPLSCPSALGSRPAEPSAQTPATRISSSKLSRKPKGLGLPWASNCRGTQC